MLNDYECPLVSLTKNISTVDCNQVKCAVSLVHDCTDGCKFEERDSSRRIEQKLTNEKTSMINIMYCLLRVMRIVLFVTCFVSTL